MVNGTTFFEIKTNQIQPFQIIKWIKAEKGHESNSSI